MIDSASFYDATLCKTTSLACRSNVLGLFDGLVELGDIPHFVKGEVLVDSRGESFQR